MFTASQPNDLWKFNWDFTDPHGTKIASVSSPDCAEPTNARVSFKGMYPGRWQKNVEIVIAGHTYRIDYEMLNWK